MILYATCSLNRDYLTPYHPGLNLTPAIEAFARRGKVFRRHHTEAGQSGVAFASIFSGTQAYRHGAFYHPTRLPESLYLATEAFGDAGYETYFWSGHTMAGARLGYGQGVDPANVIERQPREDPPIEQLTATEPRFANLLSELRDDPEARAFVQVNFTLTHHPYGEYLSPQEFERFRAAHPELRTGLTDEELSQSLKLYLDNKLGLQWNYAETVEALGMSAEEQERLRATLELYYQASVAQLDESFGRLIAMVREHGLEEEALIAFTADHGEILYRENALFRWTHGMQLAPEVIQVPLIVVGPGVQPGDYQGVTRSIDVYPTLAGLCALDTEALVGVDGQDLSEVLRGLRDEPELEAFAHTAVLTSGQLNKSPGMTLRDTYFPEPAPESMWTLMRRGAFAFRRRRTSTGEWIVQAFDWDRDAGESHDLFDPGDPDHVAVAKRLAAYQALLIDAYHQHVSAGPEALSEDETLERLRDLGYIGR